MNMLGGFLMAAEKNFENRVRDWLHGLGIYPAGMPEDKQTVAPAGWYLKIWGGGFQKSGIPDLLMCANGFFLAVELKSSAGTPTELQKKNIRMVNNGGGIGLVLYPEGFEKFKNIVKGVIGCNSAIAELNALKAVHSSTKCDTLTE
jgi:hypothetical protein